MKALIFLCLSCIFLSACAGKRVVDSNDRRYETEMQKEMSGAVSIHTILTHSVNKEKELVIQDFYSDHDIIVEAVPWLTSAEIRDIQPVERPISMREIYDLKLELTDKGRKQWEAIVKNDNPEVGYAFLVDGIFYTSFHPRRFYNAAGREIVVDGPFDKVVAELLYRQSPLNYLKLKKMQNKDTQKP